MHKYKINNQVRGRDIQNKCVDNNKLTVNSNQLKSKLTGQAISHNMLRNLNSSLLREEYVLMISFRRTMKVS